MPFLKINSKKKKKVNRSTNNLRWEKVNMAFAKEMVLLKSTGVFEWLDKHREGKFGMKEE